jgi:hypothetical protein
VGRLDACAGKRPLPRPIWLGIFKSSWLLFASDEGGAPEGCPSECNEHNHCSRKITERCTMKLTVVATPWAMTNAMI